MATGYTTVPEDMLNDLMQYINTGMFKEAFNNADLDKPKKRTGLRGVIDEEVNRIRAL